MIKYCRVWEEHNICLSWIYKRVIEDLDRYVMVKVRVCDILLFSLH